MVFMLMKQPECHCKILLHYKNSGNCCFTLRCYYEPDVNMRLLYVTNFYIDEIIQTFLQFFFVHSMHSYNKIQFSV